MAIIKFKKGFATKYKKKRRRRKKRGKRPSTLAKTNAQRINKLVSADKTFIDILFDENITTAGDFFDVGLTDIATGSNEGQKQGDKIVVKSLQFRLRYSTLNSVLVDGDAFNNIRMILVKFPQPNQTGLPLSASDILQPPAKWDSLYRKRPTTKYKILFDKLIYLDNQQKPGTTPYPRWIPVAKHQQICNVNFNFPKGLTVTYVPTQSTVIKNDLRLFLISDSSLPGHPTVDGHARINFLS